MATTRLTDVIDVKVYNDLPAVDSPEKTALFESGIIDNSPLLSELANGPGAVAELPFWRDIDSATGPNLSSDDPAVLATADKITQGSQVTRKAFLNKVLSAMDLARELAMGDDAIVHIKNRVESYWFKQFQRRLIATANGVLAANVANNGGDMVNDASANLISGITANTVFTRANFTAAVFTMGDAFSDLAAIAVHSVVFRRMVNNNDIVYIRPSDGTIDIPTYLGKMVIVDDSMPFVPGDTTNAEKYTSILFGIGAFGYGEGTPTVPTAVTRVEEAGNGGGEERLTTRKTWIVHPFGYKVNTSVAPAGGAASYSLAQLATAALWDRVVERKNVPLAFLVTNG